MSISTKKRQKLANNSYARACKVSAELLLTQILARKLDAEQGMHLLTLYALELDSMLRRKDREPPFISRAMARALDLAGIENYETALAKLTNQ